MTIFSDYLETARSALARIDALAVQRLAAQIRSVWSADGQVLACGNGGSAANAIHLCNDLIYGVAPGSADGVRALALCANQSVMTCLANDASYDQVFAYQVAVHGRPGDLLIVFSGSGNSPNVVNALVEARRRGLRTAAILGFSGGRCLTLADVAVHIPVDDMQIAEDCQQTVSHLVTRWLEANRPLRSAVEEPALAHL
jgi:D-sedoheptulose 7-phosphate isomerase